MIFPIRILKEKGVGQNTKCVGFVLIFQIFLLSIVIILMSTGMMKVNRMEIMKMYEIVLENMFLRYEHLMKLLMVKSNDI